MDIIRGVCGLLDILILVMDTCRSEFVLAVRLKGCYGFHHSMESEDVANADDQTFPQLNAALRSLVFPTNSGHAAK